jgi:hypothetical protein
MIVLILLVCASPAYTSEWTGTDLGLQSIDAGLMYIDWKQTSQFSKNPKYYELNPIIGKHPSQDKINAYFITSLLLKTLIANELPHPQRTWWQVFIISVSMICIYRNESIGIGIQF